MMRMEILAAVAKINKYGTVESGDTLEVVERPHGGISMVMADGQTSGRGAKVVSAMVVRKVISLLAEGVRDGAAARAANDYLFTERNGKVTACLGILSADLQTSTVVIVRNAPTPVFVARHDHLECLSGESSPIGTSRSIRPAITEIPLEPGIMVIMYTDGLQHAGDRYGQVMDVCTSTQAFLDEESPNPQHIADALLTQAIRLDQDRPNDDMTVMVMSITDRDEDQIRRLSFQLPVPPLISS